MKLHYVVWGDEAKPPMLLIHGGRDHARNWDRVAEALLAAATSDPEARASRRAMYESFDDLVRKHLTRCVPGAEPDRIASVAWAIVCLAEQNTIMLGLGLPPRRTQQLREIARGLVDALGGSAL